MGTKKLLCPVVALLVIHLFVSSAAAQEGEPLLHRGLQEVGISTGFGWSFESDRTVNTVPLALYWGYVFSDPAKDGALRGCWEVLVEGSFNYLFHHQRKYAVGLTGLLRYNVLASQSVVPYLQAGMGVLHSNLKMDDFPPDFNFAPQAGVGFQWFLCPASALGIEYRVQHFSNAGLYKHNTGLNLHNIRISFSRYF